uniref:Uncharacterized protein n=1 Tax=Rhizophora mucronata TaxID=61149 RepID=A0A2P2NJI8_RHIMU
MYPEFLGLISSNIFLKN